MARRAYPTTFEERVAIVERASAGQSPPEIAAALHWSISTVRKWRRIGQCHGRAGLAPPIGRPPSGPLGSVLPKLRPAILQLRGAHPGWGADTILSELRTDPLWAEHPLPSRARIAALFKHAKLTRRSNRHTDLSEPATPATPTPHDEWELDAQGPLNERIPSRALGGRAPLEAYPQASHTGRFYPPEWEVEMFDFNRVYQ